MRRQLLLALAVSLCSVVPVAAQSTPQAVPAEPLSRWWAVAAAAGPLADGATTWWAMSQSGPAMRIREGNPLFKVIFRGEPKGWQVMSFKVAQAGILYAGVRTLTRNKEGVERAIYVVAVNAVVSGIASGINIHRGRRARKLNAAYTVGW